MNVTSTEHRLRRLPRLWLAVAPSLAIVLLSGCSMKRCATWDRVTQPDFMYEEHTTLHGFHRTSWESWPEEYRDSVWSRSGSSKPNTSATPNEHLPAGPPSQELPVPEDDAASPEVPEQNGSPEARSPQPRLGTTPISKPMVSPTAAPARANEDQPVELVASTEVVEPATPTVDFSLELEVAPAPYSSRFASLIAEDRKSKWRRLAGGAIPVPTPATIQKTELSPGEPALLNAAAEVLEDAPAGPAIPRGDGAVQFRSSARTLGLTLRASGDSPDADEVEPSNGDVAE